MENTQDIGSYLLQLREKFELSTRDVERLAGVNSSFLSQIERGVKKPSPKTLARLAPVYEISYENLMVVAGYLPAPETSNARSLQEKVFDPNYLPNEIDLKELLMAANINFNGERMALEDKEKILRIAEILWEERRKTEQSKKKR